MITLSSSILIALAALITAVVGYLAYLNNKKISTTASNLDATNTAITGLDVLAKQHSTELHRLSSVHTEYYLKCEEDKKNFTQAIAKNEGQIDVLKSIPLVNIDTTFQKIGEFNERVATSIESLNTNSEAILDTLKTSAETLVTDTKAAAEQVKEVKDNLAEDDKNITRKVTETNGG